MKVRPGPIWLIVALWLALAAPGAGMARADQGDPRLDGLFEALRAARSLAAAQPVEQRIWAIWSVRDDDAAVNRLMQQGMAAMAGNRLAAALASFARVTALAPDFAEGWNKRATVHYLMGSLTESMQDIRRTLALEPRHFGALSGLGLIWLALDRPQAALRAFDAALAIHPNLPGLRAWAERLRRRPPGQSL